MKPLSELLIKLILDNTTKDQARKILKELPIHELTKIPESLREEFLELFRGSD